MFVTPMVAFSAREHPEYEEWPSGLPEGEDWLYEIKLDGYRALLLKDRTMIRIRSRNDKDLTRMYPRIAAAAQKLGAGQVVLDGEIVALDTEGRPSFQSLQHRGAFPTHTIVFYAFDVLHEEGRDITGAPLSKRRGRLPAIIGGNPTLRISQELPGTAADVVNAVRAAGLEGVIAKRRDSIYQPGDRSSDWVKLKLEQQQEFVIGGYRADGAGGVDVLLVGHYDGHSLYFAGKVRAGMVPHVRRDLVRKLKPLMTDECPFVNLPDSGTRRWGGGVTTEEMSSQVWVKPVLVVQIRFQEWTAEGRLRLPKYVGLRSDKAAAEVRREG